MEDVREITPLDSTSTFVCEELSNADVVHVFGEFSLETAGAIEAALARGVRIGRTTVCDLLGCSYLDAAGLGVLMRARHSLGSSFSVVKPTRGIVRRMLDISGITDLM